LVDLTPGTDAIGYCNYTGPNVPGNGNEPHSGQPVCNGGSPLDFNNNTTFDAVRLQRQRMLFGLNYRYEMVMVGGEFIWEIIPPEDAQSDEDDKAALAGEDKQWTIALELGAMF
jgi:hypothetical protein